MEEQALDFISKTTGLSPDKIELKSEQKDPVYDFILATTGQQYSAPETPRKTPVYNDALDSATRAFNLSSVYTDPLESYGKYGVALNPYSDWNEQRAQRQSTWDKWRNGLIKAGITTVGAVGENTLGVLAGLGSLATGGSYYDNFVGKGIDNINDWAQTNLPNYYTQAEQKAGVLEGMGTANFWADKVANGVGYSLGSIATMWLGTGELGLAAKGIGKVAGAAGKAAKAVGIAGKTGVILEDAALIGSKQLAMYRAGKAIETGEKLERMAKIARFSTAAERLSVATQMSLAESSVEAREAKNRFIEEETIKWEELNPGQEVPEDVMNGIVESANAVGNTTFAINLPILATSNLIMFGNMFRGARVGERAIYNLERTALNPAKWAQSMGDGKLAKAFTNSSRIFAKPVQGMITEGFQEGSQFAASEFSRDYYGSKFSDGFGDMSKSISQSLSATFGTKEGLENMLIGAIVGGGTGAVSRIAGADSKLAKARTANSEKALEALNSGGLTRLMETMDQNDYNVRRANIMEEAQKVMSNPNATSSQKMQSKQAFERAQTQLIRSEARRYSKMGGLDYFLEQLDDAKAMPEKEFKEAFGFDVSIPLMDQAGKSQAEIVDDVRKTVELSEKRALQVEAILARTQPKSTFLPKLMESFQSEKTKSNKQIQGIVRNMYANMLHERLLDIDVLDNQIDDTYRELEKLSPAISAMGLEDFVYQVKIGNVSVSDEGKISIKGGTEIKEDKKLEAKLNDILLAKHRLNPADAMEFKDVAVGLRNLILSRETAATAMDNLSRNPEEMDLVMQVEYAKRQQEAKEANAERAAQVVSGAETADEIRNNLPEDASPEMIAEAEARIAQLEEEENAARASMSQMTDEELEAVNEDEIPPVAAAALAKEKDERENAERIRQQQRSINSPQLEQVDSEGNRRQERTIGYEQAASDLQTSITEAAREISDAEDAALGEISVSPGGQIFTINGRTYLNLNDTSTDAIIYDENGERQGFKLTDAATGNEITWMLRDYITEYSVEAETESAIVDAVTYAILLHASSIRSIEQLATQTVNEARTIAEIRGTAAIADALEKQGKELKIAQEDGPAKLKNFEITQTEEDPEAFEKEQAELANLVATTNLGQTVGMTDSQIRAQLEVIKQDLIEIEEILEAYRQLAMQTDENGKPLFTKKEFDQDGQVKTLKAVKKTNKTLFTKKTKELAARKKAAKTIDEATPAPEEVEQVIPQEAADELIEGVQNKIKRLQDEIVQLEKQGLEYERMIDGTYPGQDVSSAKAKLRGVNVKIANRKANIQKETNLIERINEERAAEKLRQAGDTAEGTDTTTEGEESETTDINPRAGSTEEGLDGTTTDEELELIRQRFEEQSKFDDEDPANFEEPVENGQSPFNDFTLTVEGPTNIQLLAGSVTPAENPDKTKNWNITIVESNGISINRIPVPEVNGVPILISPELLSSADQTPVGTQVKFEVDETADWWNSEDPKTKNNKKDLTEDEYWKHVPIYMVATLPNGTEVRVAMLQSANDESGSSRKDIYELYKNGLTPTATITGKKFNNSNIINARTSTGQTYFYPASLIAGEQPIIAAVVMRGSEAKWVASTTDEAVQAQVGSKATVKQQGEKEGEQSVAFGQVGIVVKDPNGNSTVIVASTKDMTQEGAAKAINYIIADEPQPELYAEIVGVNKFPAIIESDEDTIEVDPQDAGDVNSEKFIATNKLTDGTEVFTFYSKSANSLVRLNAEELKKALLGQKFKFSFTETAPNERGWLDFVTVKKNQEAYSAVADNLGKEFRDITMQKKFQVSLGSMMNSAPYVSPLTGTQYNSYFEYLTSTTEFSEPRTDGLGANAILTTDKYAHGPSSPYYDVGVSLSQLTTLEGDVKTEEEMELKQVVETSKPAPQTRPTTTTIKITSSPSKSSPMLKGEIITPDGKGNFTVKVLEDGTAYIYDIQLGDFQESDKTKNKGYGLQAYIQIGQEVQRLGYTLESTHWDKHTAGISPQALRVWEKLVEKGYAEVTGTTESKVYNRETGDEEVKTINIYKFKTPGAAVATITQPATPATQTLPGPETKINIYAGTGENAELSNFANRPFIASAAGLNEDEWPAQGKFNTVEGAYQAQKIAYTSKATEEENKFNLEILAKLRTASGAQAKSLGRQIKAVDTKDWDADSSTVMKNLLLESFDQNPNALAKLLATGDATLTHTQDRGKWGKEFPKLLMEVREELSSVENVPAATTPAVVPAPAAPKVTSSSQVIEDDLSLLMNPNKPIEEKPVSSDIIILPFDPNAAAVSASEKASVNEAQTEELSKALGAPMSDFGALAAAEKARIAREAGEAKGGENEINCI